MNLDGERRELTFVFTDLTDFTALVESLDPSIIVPLLNEYLDEMTQIVFRRTCLGRRFESSANKRCQSGQDNDQGGVEKIAVGSHQRHGDERVTQQATDRRRRGMT